MVGTGVVTVAVSQWPVRPHIAPRHPRECDGRQLETRIDSTVARPTRLDFPRESRSLFA